MKHAKLGIYLMIYWTKAMEESGHFSILFE